MKWSVIQLQKFRDKGLEIDEMVDMSHLTSRDTDIRKLAPVHIEGRADIGTNKVTFHLNVEGQMVLPCSRTLVDVDYPFNFSLTETYLLKASLAEEYQESESVHLVQGDVIDLQPVLEEEILLAVPMQVISEEADEHVLSSGKGWDYKDAESDTEEEAKVDPRLAGLADFFKSDEQ
ncbi:YceD family protein [Bacillus thermotolerans]|uniref:DUF177 domain-containing protein n=1 Tax=Bacillus thermotolerans TaxID=1221996 RepID=A0A0F5IAQ6_BACTR|nr:YceD family protein [Bacillus thermotolerans]KKB39241.1 hypothetical protein QY97_00143 [Bacillus thermotolerans]KKB42257.1 hypothetical protein QY95_00106 [Bacillus thermotolerans]